MTAHGPGRSRGPWRSTTIVFAGNVIARALGFLFPVALARALDRPDFALVYFYVNTGFFVGELVLAGFPTALTRRLAAHEGTPGATWLAASIAGGLPLLGASIAAGVAFAVWADASPALLALVIVGLSVDAYYFAALRGLGRFGLLVGYRIGANLAQILAVGAAWATGGASVGLFVAVYALSYLVPILVIELVIGPVRAMRPLLGRPTRAAVRDLTRFAIPALIAGTAYAGIVGLDIFWVRILAPDALADYAAARTLAMPISLVAFAVGVVLMPAVARAGAVERRTLLFRAMATTAAAGAVVVAGYVLLAPWLVAVLFPPGFSEAAGLIPLLAAGIGGMSVYSILTQWWMGTGRPATPAAVLVIAAVVAAAAHLALDGELGGLGAAWALVIAAAVATVLLLLATARALRQA